MASAGGTTDIVNLIYQNEWCFYCQFDVCAPELIGGAK